MLSSTQMNVIKKNFWYVYNTIISVNIVLFFHLTILNDTEKNNSE